MHTTHSDGECSPSAVVLAAAGVGLDAIAITDHDTVSALPVARVEADRLGITLINGVEISSHDGRRGAHLLAYFVNLDDPALTQALEHLRLARVERMREIVERLGKRGVVVDLERLRARTPRAVLGRRHLADWLVGQGIVPNRVAAFAMWLGEGAPAHVPSPCLEAEHALALIHGAGGVAALAHPPYDSTYESFRVWRDRGMVAVEVDGPGFRRPVSARFREWAGRLGLIPIAGSDFHAPDGPGRWVGAITTPGDDWRRLRERAGAGSVPSPSSSSP